MLSVPQNTKWWLLVNWCLIDGQLASWIVHASPQHKGASVLFSKLTELKQNLCLHQCDNVHCRITIDLRKCSNRTKRYLINKKQCLIQKFYR